MFGKFSTLLVHFVGAALACAQLAYWSIRVTTAPPTPAPPQARVLAARQPDPVQLARAFGLVEAANVVSGNIQVAGVFAAGADSAAVMQVDDRPARAVLLGQEVAPGSTLVEIDQQGVTLESGGVRRQLRVPQVPLASFPASAGAAPFTRRGNVLSAPTVEGAAATVRPAPRPAQLAMPNRGEPMPGPGRVPNAGSPIAQ